MIEVLFGANVPDKHGTQLDCCKLNPGRHSVHLDPSMHDPQFLAHTTHNYKSQL